MAKRLVGGLILIVLLAGVGYFALYYRAFMAFDDCMRPLGTMRVPVAMISGPTLQPPGPPGVGACQTQVEFDGRRYIEEELEPPPTITDADVERIGSATAGYALFGEFPNHDVYAVEGIDPQRLIVMRFPTWAPPMYRIFRSSQTLPSGLCAFFSPPPDNSDINCSSP